MKRSRRSSRGAFTLVEVLVSLAVAMLIMGAILTTVIMSMRTMKKISLIDEAATQTRLIQEHLNKELAASISQKSPIRIMPAYDDASTTTPVRYGSITYRTTIGSFATASFTSYGSSTITLDCPADVSVEIGDFLMIDDPKLGTVSGSETTAGARIEQVTDSRSPNSSGSVTIKLNQSIGGNTLSSTKTNVLDGTLATIQRERRYQTVQNPDDANLAELRWYENSQSDEYQVLSKNVDANSRYLFAQVTAESDTKGDEPGISWQISYLASDRSAYLPGGEPTYYQTNYSEGLTMAKSGNPLNTSSYAGVTTSTSISTTTTSSTTSSSTTTTKSTTTKSTTTSTTSKSTTSTTSKSTTSTTSKSTTSTTSKSSTSTSTTSTTSKSTTSTTTTKSTTTSTTSKSTSSTTTTTSKSTSSTTSKTTSIPLDG